MAATTDDAQRARLLEGLAASIREKGLAQTQLADIVRHARASRRTFYKHFPDKDSAYVELMQHISVGVRARIVAAVDPDADWRTQVAQAIEHYLSELASEPQLTLTFASPSLGAQVVEAQRAAMERYAELVVGLSEGAAFRAAGTRRISLAQAYMLVGGLHVTVVRAVQRGEDLTGLAPEFETVFAAVLDTPRY